MKVHLLIVSVLVGSHVSFSCPEREPVRFTNIQENVLVGSYVTLSEREPVRFTIIHNNDLHSKFEQVSASLSICTKYLEESQRCYGGFARQAHMIRKLRKDAADNGKSLIYLFAGDVFTGTIYFSKFKGEICSRFMNLLSPDAMALGNHEFDDDGLNGLVKYVASMNSTVLAANVDFPEDVTINVKSSKVMTVNGTQIGIIGLLTPETKVLSVNTGNVVFHDEIDVINKEAAKLKEQGINIIIALTHSGYKVDEIIARDCPDVDIVVGGHSHSFLFSGTINENQPEAKDIMGPYPTLVRKADGRLATVVQAFCFSKYLGQIDVEFDASGNLQNVTGAPILLDSSVPQDKDVLDILDEYKRQLPNDTEVIGYTNVQLDGITECRNSECNLGNLIMDSIIYHRIKTLMDDPEFNYFTDTTIAVMNAGGIRAAIDKRPGGALTKRDIMLVLPFQNKFSIVELTGKTILKALEYSGKEFTAGNAAGGILQMSGLQVVYNITKPVGERVEKVMVLCAECDTPKYDPLDDTKLYNVLVSDYLHKGGGGYVFVEDGMKKPIDLEPDQSDFVIDYIKDHKIIYPLLDGRIVVLK